MSGLFKKRREKQEKLDDYVVFSNYKNEYSVCNGIEILEMLEYPANSEGIDFLFECLRDVDEAYFLPAINVLQTYPKEVLKEKIEVNAKSAYEAGNVQKYAGVMYLAKEIGYKIEFTRKLREQAAEEKTDIPVFTVDEEYAYTGDEALKFNPGSVAYAYKEDEMGK